MENGEGRNPCEETTLNQFMWTASIEWVIIHSGILVDYKNKMTKDTTVKPMLFERTYSKFLFCI